MPMTLIARTTLSGTAASVTLSNIPQTFQTLKLVVSARTDRTGSTEDALRISFNGSGGTAYSSRMVYGTGTGTGSTSYSSSAYTMNFSVDSADATASTFGNGEMTIPNYSGSTNKAVSSDVVSENNSSSATQGLNAGLWANTSSIASIVVSPNAGTNFVSGCTFSLYGIG